MVLLLTVKVTVAIIVLIKELSYL